MPEGGGYRADARLTSNRVTGIDWLIVAFTALLAFYGYMQGFIVGALSLVGFGARRVRRHAARPAAAAGRLALAVRAAVRSARRAARRRRARQRLRGPRRPRSCDPCGCRAADDRRTARGGADRVRRARDRMDRRRRGARLLGLAPLRRDIQQSAILQELNTLLPPSGRILNALARFDPLPSVTGPEADVARPNAAILRTSGVDRRARQRRARSSEPRAVWGSRAAQATIFTSPSIIWYIQNHSSPNPRRYFDLNSIHLILN